MIDELEFKAQFIHDRLVDLYKDSGLDKDLSRICGRDWALTLDELKQALIKRDDFGSILERQFVKLGLLIGASEFDARLIGLRAIYKAKVLGRGNADDNP